MSSPRQQQSWHPIEKLQMFEEMLEDSMTATEENYATFLEAKSRPHALDDSMINRAMKIYAEQIEYVNCYDNQLNRWKKGPLTPNQREKVDGLAIGNKRRRELTENLISLLKELKKGTINRILEMDDEELGLNALGEGN